MLSESSYRSYKENYALSRERASEHASTKEPFPFVGIVKNLINARGMRAVRGRSRYHRDRLSLHPHKMRIAYTESVCFENIAIFRGIYLPWRNFYDFVTSVRSLAPPHAHIRQEEECYDERS